MSALQIDGQEASSRMQLLIRAANPEITAGIIEQDLKSQTDEERRLSIENQINSAKRFIATNMLFVDRLDPVLGDILVRNIRTLERANQVLGPDHKVTIETAARLAGWQSTVSVSRTLFA